MRALAASGNPRRLTRQALLVGFEESQLGCGLRYAVPYALQHKQQVERFDKRMEQRCLVPVNTSQIRYRGSQGFGGLVRWRNVDFLPTYNLMAVLGVSETGFVFLISALR